jgi:hypothetical protein
MWKLGLRPLYSFSGNICFKMSAFFLCSVKCGIQLSYTHTLDLFLKIMSMPLGIYFSLYFLRPLGSYLLDYLACVVCPGWASCRKHRCPERAQHHVVFTLAVAQEQGVTKRCRLSWLINSALVYEPKCGGRGELRGP